MCESALKLKLSWTKLSKLIGCWKPCGLTRLSSSITLSCLLSCIVSRFSWKLNFNFPVACEYSRLSFASATTSETRRRMKGGCIRRLIFQSIQKLTSVNGINVMYCNAARRRATSGVYFFHQTPLVPRPLFDRPHWLRAWNSLWIVSIFFLAWGSIYLPFCKAVFLSKILL